ncbi:M48 family metallopeptidase [Dysgonomonas macrotermitis]|uniref:Peptidase family M48 n=1 Tax=Dysgonomonas macrotermitis TaxID=1346286 RepID=A0A1M5ACP8_9BACT|nr:M48 family metallopeptidase [Dysgonomonas macrotermitis]SHF27806.1 Peptidase family M48 [Dysgonomonas macrotermitis]
MKYYYILLPLFSVLLLLSSCGSVPVTGRKQMLLVSDQEVLTLSLQQYDEFIKTAPKSTDKANTALVQKVGRNIANAVESYMKANGMESLISSYSWEFNLVKSAEVNAFCMPGGKIVVYEGILPITKDETGLAVVLGHEVAHAVAKHANERMSQQMAAQYGGAALGVALGGASSAVQTVASSVYGLGAQYGVMLPYSRKQELEADKLGLIFMAMAGYNPQMAESFWLRMSQNSGGQSVAEFQSTHPSDETRIKKIKEELPEAMKYYKAGNSIKSTPSNAKTSEQWKF